MVPSSCTVIVAAATVVTSTAANCNLVPATGILNSGTKYPVFPCCPKTVPLKAVALEFAISIEKIAIPGTSC